MIRDLTEVKKQSRITRRYTRRVLICDACESPAVHCEGLIAREHHASLPGLGDTDKTVKTDPHSSEGVGLTNAIQDRVESIL
jgi:hypothetical protein